MTQDFEQFWQAYPRRIGKLAAERAYTKARRLASADEILRGVAVYRRNKPDYADFCHPKTWLTQGRWMDELESEARVLYMAWVCPHDPRCASQAVCEIVARKVSA